MLSGYERSSYVLATKVYFPMSDTDRGLSAAQIHKQMDASLERLRTDYVDLYQCHRFDSHTPLQETMEALTEVVRAGKARHIGFSEWPAERIEESLALAGVERWVSSQPQYSMLWRAPEKDVIPLCEREGDLSDRVVAAGAGGADGQVPSGRAAADGLEGGEREHGRLHRQSGRAARCSRRCTGCARSPSRPA